MKRFLPSIGKSVRSRLGFAGGGKTLVITLFALAALPVSAQNRTISGKVTDSATKQPVPGVSVIVDNSSVGTSTNLDGTYTLEVPATAKVLSASCLGYDEVSHEIGNRTSIDFVITESHQKIDDVVVVGYATQKRVNVTGSVATVDSKAFDSRPIVSTSVALQGLMSGVTVTSQTGAPGADGGSIRIRGINSFGGSSTAPLVLVDGIEESLDNVDPNLIESISVLKDAASSSIYGSRAANGVILVTTKRGSQEKFTLSYKGYVGWQSPTDLPKTVNAVQFRELTNLMNENDGNPLTYDPAELEVYRQNMGKDPDLYPNTDWQKLLLNGSGFMHNHTISLGIGSERVRMLTTLGYTGNDGIIKRTDFKRYVFRHNADILFNDKLSMRLDLSFSNGDRRYSPYQNTVFNYMNTRPADIPCVFSTGLYNGLGLLGQNPLAELMEGGQNKVNNLRLSGAITLEYKPLKWLAISGMLAPRYATTNAHNYKKAVTTYQDPEGTATLVHGAPTSLTETGSRSFYGNYNAMLKIDKDFGGHNIKFIAGVERNTYDYKYLKAYREVFNYDYDQIDAGEIENQQNGGRRYQWAIQSYFGRINYNYKERYLFEANFRADGSSRFTKKNRWGYFPSVSAAWRLSEEPFMERAKDVLTNAKIRVSYGTLGNQNLSGASDTANYYPTSSNLNTGNVSMGGNIYPIVSLDTLANSDITWETTTVFDVGLDLTFWNKFNITADWYRKNTKDILMTLDIPLGIGLDAPYQNAGKVRNTGWEVSLGYQNKWRDFSFGVQANVSDVCNKIIDMRGKTATSGVLRNQEGHSIGSIYTLKAIGIIRTQEEADWVNANCPQEKGAVKIGDIRYADITGDGKVDLNDKTFVGSTIPRYTYSLNLDFGWKGIHLSALFQGVGKVDGYLNNYYVWPSYYGGTFRTEYLDSTNENNPNGKTPRLSAGYANTQDSSYWMKSAAYLRLKNLQLGYEFPRALTSKIGIQSLYVYVNAQNLFKATKFYKGFDPEIGYGGSAGSNFDSVAVGDAYSYPQVRIITVGLNLKF